MGKTTAETIILGESSLKQIHEELPDKLRAAFGKPVMLSITYLDENTKRLQHWIATSNEFLPDDIFPSLIQYGEMAKKDMIPKNQAVVQSVKQQIGKKAQQVKQRKG